MSIFFYRTAIYIIMDVHREVPWIYFSFITVLAISIIKHTFFLHIIHGIFKVVYHIMSHIMECIYTIFMPSNIYYYRRIYYRHQKSWSVCIDYIMACDIVLITLFTEYWRLTTNRVSEFMMACTHVYIMSVSVLYIISLMSHIDSNCPFVKTKKYQILFYHLFHIMISPILIIMFMDISDNKKCVEFFIFQIIYIMMSATYLILHAISYSINIQLTNTRY